MDTIDNNKHHIDDLKLIQEITAACSIIFNYREMLQFILEKFIKFTDAGSGVVLMKSGILNNVMLEASSGLSRIDAEKKIDELSGKIDVFLDDKKQHGSSYPLFEIQEDLAVGLERLYRLIIPINIDEKKTGIISINNIKRYLNKYDLELIQTISMNISQKLFKILVFKELEQKIRLKDILIEISNSIEKIFILKDVFDVVMKKLAEKFNIMRGMLVLLDRENPKKLSVFTAFNLTELEVSKGNYEVGEGIVGKVVENGKSISIPDIHKDTVFLNRMKVRRSKDFPISFIAVPIRISGVVIGVLAVEKIFESTTLLKDEEDMLFLISGMISNKVKIYQKMAEEKSVLLEENLNLKKELYEKYGVDNIIGKNKQMHEIFELIKMVADSTSSILILGESGTGKELVAKSLHFNSGRRYGPFVSINCAAIPENLLEAELFGYKKGAFTGASIDKKGKFLLADGGTLFLDEIGDMPLYLQAKLLRAIQEREIEPVGSEFKVKIDIRIISATNKDPVGLINCGKLREDLFYRLNVVEIKLPLLKERRDDIPLLIQYFIEKYSKLNDRKIKRISPEALKTLQAYHWPGNVRELENIIERAILLSKGSSIDIQDLPANIIQTEKYQTEELYIEKWIDNFIRNEKDRGKSYYNFMKIIEKEFLIKSLLKNNRNKLKTAESLGINRNTLRAKMKLYDIRI